MSIRADLARHLGRRQNPMRFMLLMIPKGYERAAPGTVPDVTADVRAAAGKLPELQP
jgi:hypothetical protein